MNAVARLGKALVVGLAFGLILAIPQWWFGLFSGDVAKYVFINVFFAAACLTLLAEQQ